MIESIIEKLEVIHDYHNKNLTSIQMQLLFEALQLLKAMKNKETFEAWYEEKAWKELKQ